MCQCVRESVCDSGPESPGVRGGVCLLGGGEDKVGKVTIEFAVLKEGPMVLSLMHWAKPLPLSGPHFLVQMISKVLSDSGNQCFTTEVASKGLC